MEAQFIDIAVEFFDVAFHNFLYIVSSSPKTAFKKYVRYGVEAYQCLLPDAQIDSVLNNITDGLQRSDISRVIFRVTDQNLQPAVDIVFMIQFQDRFEYYGTVNEYVQSCEQDFQQFLTFIIESKFKALPVDRHYMVIVEREGPLQIDLGLAEADEDTGHRELLRGISIKNLDIHPYVELARGCTFRS